MKALNLPIWMKVLENETKEMLSNHFDKTMKNITLGEYTDVQALHQLLSFKKELLELLNYEMTKEQYCYGLKQSQETIKELNKFVTVTESEIQKNVEYLSSGENEFIEEDTSLENLLETLRNENYPNKEQVEEEKATKMMPLYQKYLNNVLNSELTNGIPLASAISNPLLSELVFDKLDELGDKAFETLEKVVDFKEVTSKKVCQKEDGTILEMSAIENKTTPKAINALQSAIRDSLEKTKLAKDYLFEKVDGDVLKNLRIRNAKVDVNTSEFKFSYEDALKIIKQSFKAVSEEMSVFVEFMDENNLIEYKDMKGKGSGANAANFQAIAGFSVVFLNYNEDLKSVLTLAHELGHAYHHKKLKEVYESERYYPLIFAETASMFAEDLVLSFLMNEYRNSKELKMIRHERIVKTFDLMIMVPSRFDLESSIYNLKSNGNLSKETLNKSVKEIEKNWYGKSDGKENENSWMLTRHFMMPHNSFYNYPYYFGYLLNAFLINEMKNPDFALNFNMFLKNTGAKDARKALLDSFGYDMESKDFWLTAIKKITDNLDEDLKNV